MEKVTLQMLREANEAYPGNIESYFDLTTGAEHDADTGGDTLALFVGREIISMVEGDGLATDDARERVMRGLARAMVDLQNVIDALEEKQP